MWLQNYVGTRPCGYKTIFSPLTCMVSVQVVRRKVPGFERRNLISVHFRQYGFSEEEPGSALNQAVRSP